MYDVSPLQTGKLLFYTYNIKQSKFSAADTVDLHCWSISLCHLSLPKHTVHNQSRRAL